MLKNNNCGVIGLEFDKALIKKCKNGDVEAFEKLISDHQKKIYNLCFRYFENHDDASELSQEIFIKVYKSIATFKEESLISTWIYKITTSTCIDELRKRKNHKVVSIDDYEVDGPHIEIASKMEGPHEYFEKKEIKIEVQRAISQLSEEFKTVIILRDIQGFSYDEIADITGVPLGTVKSRIKRAREYVKEYLLEKGNFFKKVSSNE